MGLDRRRTDEESSMDLETLTAYDAAAADFATTWETQPAPADLHRIVNRFFVRGLTADIGCGSGRDVAWLVEHGFPAVGFDPSEGLLAEARARHPDCRFENAALPELVGIASTTFANVLCETVIMHMAPALVPASMQRLVDILRPDGILYLSWRVTRGTDQRDDSGRLYAAVDGELVLSSLAGVDLLLDEETMSESSGRLIHRLVARKEA
jgi:SAM-dependent methyltransferase